MTQRPLCVCPPAEFPNEPHEWYCPLYDVAQDGALLDEKPRMHDPLPDATGTP